MLVVEQKGGFFVWTRTGHKPYYRHDTHEGALKEAKRLAFKHPDRKFIIQEFHEKVFVEVEPSPSVIGGIMMENIMQKKELWAGLRHGQICFFNSDPQGTVEGLQGSRKFYVEQNGKLTDDNGGNIIENTTSGGGANTSDVSTSEAQPPQSGQQTA